MGGEVKPGDVLEALFWPEPVRVLVVQPLGHRLRIEASGVRTQKLYSCVLTQADLEKAERSSVAPMDFSGDPEAFFLAVEAHRIRLAYQFDPLFAVNVSQVDPLPHQIEAVYGYLLRSPRIRFLLADDPGAGKTIMAGLLLKELKYRGLVQRTLIVVPGHLRDQWRREMKERFAEEFVVADRGVVEATWGRNFWQEESQVITSMDFAKQADIMEMLADVHWDLVIVDEAHKMAAYRYGEKTNKTERYRLGELLSSRSQSLLFLTATPHRGDPENFRLFLNLLEPGFFANVDLLVESIRDGDNPLFLRRLKEDLRDFEGRPLFPPRYVFTRTYRLNSGEKQLYDAVTEYVKQWYNIALERKKRNVAFLMVLLQRRLASSVRAVRRSLERMRKKRLERPLGLGQLVTEKAYIDEEEMEDAPEGERLLKEEELESYTAAETLEELEVELQMLERLIHLAREAEKQEIETKLQELRQVIEEERIRGRGEKILIFTEFRETLEYLAEKLRQWGFNVVTLHGGMRLEDRIRAENEFRERAQVMVSTEAGGEGINLQFCSLMVNYDVPWNPNRLEQRMGRIHRYGQRKEVHIYNLVAYDTIEGRVLQALFDKLDKIRKALGSDRVFDVIGDIVPGRSLKDLIMDAISRRRNLEEILAEIEAVPDEEAIRKAREATLEALATRHIDLQRVLGEDRRARENRLVPEYIERFFERACRFLGLKVERRRDGLLRVPHVPSELRNVPQEFKRKFGEVFREYNKIAFDKEVAKRHEAVFVAPGHPLLEALIEAVFVRCDKDLQRGAVFADPDGKLNGWLWVVQGEIRDGEDQVAGKRLFVIFQPVGGGPLRLMNTSLLWDLKPLRGFKYTEPCPSDEEVLSFAVDNVLEPFQKEMAQEREREARVKEKYGIRSLEQMILEVETRLMEYEIRRSKGEHVPEVEIINAERRKEDYENRKRSLEEKIRRQMNLLPTMPKVLGVARVVPEEGEQAMAYDEAIEAIGMQVAMQYEREQGRVPEDVSAQKLGYDIRSKANDGSVRYIEVKSHARSGPLVLTPNEWLMAQRLGKEYWLYIVENAATTPTLYIIQNPAAKLHPEEMKEVVRYVVKDWKNSSIMQED